MPDSPSSIEVPHDGSTKPFSLGRLTSGFEVLTLWHRPRATSTAALVNPNETPASVNSSSSGMTHPQTTTSNSLPDAAASTVNHVPVASEAPSPILEQGSSNPALTVDAETEARTAHQDSLMQDLLLVKPDRVDALSDFVHKYSETLLELAALSEESIQTYDLGHIVGRLGVSGGKRESSPWALLKDHRFTADDEMALREASAVLGVCRLGRDQVAKSLHTQSDGESGKPTRALGAGTKQEQGGIPSGSTVDERSQTRVQEEANHTLAAVREAQILFLSSHPDLLSRMLQNLTLPQLKAKGIIPDLDYDAEVQFVDQKLVARTLLEDVDEITMDLDLPPIGGKWENAAEVKDKYSMMKPDLRGYWMTLLIDGGEAVRRRQVEATSAMEQPRGHSRKEGKIWANIAHKRANNALTERLREFKSAVSKQANQTGSLAADA